MEMKRIYLKPNTKIVSCRPMCFIAASKPDWNWDEKPEDLDGDIDDETEPIPQGARAYIWD